MRRSPGLAAAVLAILTPGCATRPAPPITAEQANRLPTQQVAEIVLRQFAGRIRSMTRPNYDSLLLPGWPLMNVAFATAPTSSYFPGLCEATVLMVGFGDRMPQPPPGRNGPVRAQSLSTHMVYKIVGEIDLPSGLSWEDRDRQSARCAALEQVLPPEEHRLGHRQFFSFHGELSAAFGAAILQRLLREVRGGTHTDHQCGRTRGCTDATAMLRALSLDDLLGIGIARAPQSPGTYIVTATFLVSGTNDTITTDEVTVEAELDAEAPPRSIRRLGQAMIDRTTLIRD